MLTTKLHKVPVSHGKGPCKETKGREDAPEIAIQNSWIPTRSTAKRQQRSSGHKHHETQLYSIVLSAADFSLSSPTRQFTHSNNALFLGTLNASSEPNPTVQAHHARTGFSLSLSVRVSPQKELGVHHLFCTEYHSFKLDLKILEPARKTSVAALKN
ncbi:hypothetical protein FVEG_16096 [Fusarium verticillioides 7600]|uniref:Uncharacterized protein n=1 Tax=Gibberella moniliformis (strain M3125 / FGSC 7600) TaxID=334819 RepID=W7M8E4_GIBM7|nr:hypothetical protein FVEG_16096 [Fusarium verticillioides 7600]EWG47276.1 hypothetical protein FVEG_16096 [Fusarium verticillioides 7600]